MNTRSYLKVITFSISLVLTLMVAGLYASVKVEAIDVQLPDNSQKISNPETVTHATFLNKQDQKSGNAIGILASIETNDKQIIEKNDEAEENGKLSQKEAIVNNDQASNKNIKNHEEPLISASNEKEVIDSSNATIPGLDESESEQDMVTSEVIKQEQGSPVDYKSRGRSYFKKGQIDDAISDLNKAIEVNPEDATTYFYRGNAFHEKGQIENAVSDYTKAIDKNPRYANAYFSRGYIYLTTGEYNKAISDYNMVIEIHPDNSYAYNYRGCGYFAQKEYQGALDDFSKAIELDPGYIEPYRNRGYIYGVKEKYRKAIEDYSKAIELNPDDAVNYFLRGIAYWNERSNFTRTRTLRALSDFDMAIKINPKFVDAYVNIAYIYYNKGNYSKAIENNEKALALNPDNVIAKRWQLIYYNRRLYGDLEYKSFSEWDPAAAVRQAAEMPALSEIYSQQYLNSKK